jgi:Fe-S-cluster-containing hydrogenase component 2
MIIVDKPEACTGCLICEMACSFHHTRTYSRSQSSIKVNKSIVEPKRGPSIVICLENERRIPVCDMCKKEAFPLCIQYCPENVFKLKRRPE